MDYTHTHILKCIRKEMDKDIANTKMVTSNTSIQYTAHKNIARAHSELF